MNLEIKLTTYIISRLVAVRCMKLPTRFLYSVEYALGLSSSMVKFVHVSTGVGVSLQLTIMNLLSTSLAYLL